jgi:hypothetical protein
MTLEAVVEGRASSVMYGGKGDVFVHVGSYGND